MKGRLLSLTDSQEPDVVRALALEALCSIPSIEIRHSGTCCLVSSLSWERGNNLKMETYEKKTIVQWSEGAYE